MAVRLAILLLAISLCLGAETSRGCKLSNGQTIPVGKSASDPGKCQKVTCQGPGRVSAINCAEFVPAPGCTKTKIDFSKPYPNCCPKPVCRGKP